MFIMFIKGCAEMKATAYHVQKMKDTLTDEYKLRQHSILNEEEAEKEAQELAQLL